MNLLQKLAKIRKSVEFVKKDKAGFGYKYVSEDTILAKIAGKMDALGVSLIPGISPATTEVTPYSYEKTKAKKDGVVTTERVNDVIVKADAVFTWVDNENPDDKIVVPWAIVGQQSEASQAFGSGLTYASRYFLLKYFNIATSEDDPEIWDKKKKESETKENREVCETIKEKIRTKLSRYVSLHPDAEKEISEFLRGIIMVNGKRTQDYRLITDPVLAANVLGQLNEKYPD